MADNRLDGLLRVAQEQKQAQEMMMGALQATLRNPHTVTRHRTHIIAVAVEDNQTVLQIATPTGARVDVEMDPQTAAQVARGLLVRPKEAEAESEAA